MRLIKEDNLYQLTYLPNLFPVNVYFIEEDDHLVLIDTAMKQNKDAILNAAKEIGKPIKKIVLTHVHTDHIGALDGLKEELRDVEVLIPRRELKLLEGDLSLEDGEGSKPVKGGVPKGVKTRPDRVLEDGDHFGSMLAIHAPGHTPGQMAFLDTRTNALVAGDAFQTRGGMAVSGDLRWTFPFPAMATWDKRVAVETAEKLLSYQPTYLGVGHGESLHNPGQAITEAITKAKHRLQKER